MSEYHIPVLLEESVKELNINPNGIYVDATFGGGGHSRKILEFLENGKLYAFDQDPESKNNLPNDPNIILLEKNFGTLKRSLNEVGVFEVDGILADLGVSSHQFDTPNRGFSFRFEEEDLDMRMNTNQELTAATVLNEYPVFDLARIFYEFGELRQSRAIARQIDLQRAIKPFRKVKDLIEAVSSFLPPFKQSKFLAPVFQALRIEVNEEIYNLKDFLEQGLEILKPEGRMVFISYHSLEDRLVKNFFKSGNFEGEVKKDFYGNPLIPWNLSIKKFIEPSAEEIHNNSRARSAKLRSAIKK